MAAGLFEYIHIDSLFRMVRSAGAIFPEFKEQEMLISAQVVQHDRYCPFDFRQRRFLSALSTTGFFDLFPDHEVILMMGWVSFIDGPMIHRRLGGLSQKLGRSYCF